MEGKDTSRGKDLKRQIANFEELVGNILSTGERAGGADNTAMLDQLIALHGAIEENNVEAVAQLAQAATDIDAKFDENVNPQHAGITPLALACATDKVDILRVLLDNGANVNAPFAALNTTALMTSSYHGHLDVVRLLLERGADVQMIDLQQSTALGYAFGGTRNLDVVQLLLDQRIDVNRKNMLGMNALLLVAGYGNEALVEKILRAGADPNTINDFGHSALHLTVVGKRDLLKKLRRLGSAEAVASDRSLNRRNLDVAIQEWARLHRDEVGGTKEDEEALAKAGSIMMSVGHQLDDGPGEEDDEQAILQRRVQAVWKHRQEKMEKNKQKNKSGIWSLLSCGGGRSSKVDDKNTPGGAKPYAPVEQRQESPPKDEGEYAKLSQGFARILRLLIDAGCQIDSTEKTFGMTALDLAILNGDVESSAVLTSAGADPNHFLKMLSLKELYQAIVTGQRKDVKTLLACDEDLDIHQAFSRFNIDPQSNDEGLTPLTLAVRQDDMEIVKMLLKKGANVNQMGPCGRFPLAEASAKGNQKMVQLLLSNGADLEKRCPAMQDSTPVTIAANMQHHKLVEFYIKKGAKVDLQMSDGRTALIKASEARDMEMVELILGTSTQENFTELQGMTAHLCAEYQSKDRDSEAILSRVSDAVRAFQEAEDGHETTGTVDLEVQQNGPQVVHDYEPSEDQPLRPSQYPVQPLPVVQTQTQPQPEPTPPRLEQEQEPEPEPEPVINVMAPRPVRQSPEPVHATPEQQETFQEAAVKPRQQAHVVRPSEPFTRGPPPPAPTTIPPEEPAPQAIAFSANVEANPPEQEEEYEENSSEESSEYETDTDEEEEEEEEEEEDAGTPERPIISVMQTEATAVAVAEEMYVEGETDIDAIDEMSPSSHETSDVNENVVKLTEENDEATEAPLPTAADRDTPPPVPITSPPRDTNETTV